MYKDKLFIGFFIFLAFFMAFFLGVPILRMLFGLGAHSFIETLKDGEVISSIILTMKVSFFAMLFALLTGLPLAYVIARYDFVGKSFLESLIDIPMMLPHTAAGIALFSTFGVSAIGDMFKSIGISFIGTESGILIAMMFLSASFLINAAKDGFRKVNVRYERVARTLGASPLQVFNRITMPNAKKDIINGCLMMWARGLGEFGAVVILTYHPMTTPVLIYDRFNTYGLEGSVPVTAVIIAFSMGVFMLVRFVMSILK